MFDEPFHDNGMNQAVAEKRRRPLTERGRLRRERILHETRRLINERGCASVTMEEIAASAGVTKKTIYDIHGSKDMLLASAMSSRMNSLLEDVRPIAVSDPFDRLLLIIERTIEAVLEYPRLAKAVEPILLVDPGQFAVAEYFDALHRPCIEDMCKRDWLTDAADPDFISRSMMFDQIAIQNFWTNGLILDTQLASFARLSICRVLLPLAQDTLAAKIRALSNQLHTELADWGRQTTTV